MKIKALENLDFRLVVFHVIVIGISIAMPFVLYLRSDHDPRFLWTVVMVSSLAPFYILNVYLFIPKYLKRGKYVTYVSILLLTITVAYFLLHYLSQKYLMAPAPPMPRVPPPDMKRPGFGIPPPAIIFPLIIYYALGISFETIIESEKQKRIKEEALKEKVNAELSFLKSQINPHFLFNTLNNIYSLSSKKSDATDDAILLLSDMMRYMLYESNVAKVPLENEIKHIENYIALQRLRISGKNDISIVFSYDGKPNGHMVEPLLFIPFVENAFKHGISYKEPSVINLKLRILEKQLIFESLNTRPKQKDTELAESSGIGLKNLERRLNLLYPNQSKLRYNCENDFFCAKLELNMA
jgi:hypothetical protein